MSQLPPVGKTSVLEARTSPVIVDKLIRQARIYLENRLVFSIYFFSYLFELVPR